MARKATETARRLGLSAGRAAASWYFDGNTKDETYARVRQGIDDGDPEVLDTFKFPDLSGEWADGLTPDALMGNVYAHPERMMDRQDDICAAWEEGAQEGYMAEIERVLSEMLPTATGGAR